MSTYQAGLPRYIQRMLDKSVALRPKTPPYWNTRKPGEVQSTPAHDGCLMWLPSVQDDPEDDLGDPWDLAARPVGLTGQ